MIQLEDGLTISERAGGRGIVDRYNRECEGSVEFASDVIDRSTEDRVAERVTKEAVAAGVSCLSWILTCSDVDSVYIAGGIWSHSVPFRKAVRAGLQSHLPEAVWRGRVRSARSEWIGVTGAALLTQDNKGLVQETDRKARK